ncbi:MAG: hypothetical protein AAF603_08980 [Pseudomonadota bacterium]
MSKFIPLLDKLEQNGWQISPVELASDCWWAKEIWSLQSLWSPVGNKIYLSLLVDPGWEGDFNNLPDNAVWAVGLAHTVPDIRSVDDNWTTFVKNNYAEMIQETVAKAAEMQGDISS